MEFLSISKISTFVSLNIQFAKCVEKPLHWYVTFVFDHSIIGYYVIIYLLSVLLMRVFLNCYVNSFHAGDVNVNQESTKHLCLHKT